MFFGFGLKTFEMIMIVLNTSYIIGMLWLIICTAMGDFVHESHNPDHVFSEKEKEDFFITHFDFKSLDSVDRAIVSTYFAFTSLSTVGFGDYHPRSNIERMVGAFILMFGVAIFSFIMGNFIQMVETLGNYNEDPDYGIELYKFFGTIKKFNYDRELDMELVNRIEEYFEYRWANDKNLPFSQEDNHQFFIQLP